MNKIQILCDTCQTSKKLGKGNTVPATGMSSGRLHSLLNKESFQGDPGNTQFVHAHAKSRNPRHADANSDKCSMLYVTIVKMFPSSVSVTENPVSGYDISFVCQRRLIIDHRPVGVEEGLSITETSRSAGGSVEC